MIYIGIDPGVSGGIAVLEERASANGVLEIQTFKMPATERDLLDVIEPYGCRHTFNATAPGGIVHAARVVLERVSASPQMGVVSAFTFGRGYGALKMALTAARIPFDEVTPQTWQKVMGCLSRGDKNITKRRAQALFPSLTVTHAIADALLIAEFCRRAERGSIQRDPQGETHGSSSRSESTEESRAECQGADGAQARTERRGGVKFTETARAGTKNQAAKHPPAWPGTHKEPRPVQARAVRR